MTTPSQREIELDGNEINTVKACPKPGRVTRKRVKRIERGICPQCGYLWKGKPEHLSQCAREIPVITVRKYKSDTDLLELALDELCRLITTWRDGCVCVTASSECRGGSTWSHFVPQGSSNYLKHNLSNSVRQCAGHNNIHRFVQLPLTLWYERKFGRKVLDEFDKIRKEHRQHKWTVWEMHNTLEFYNELYSSRFQFAGATIEELVAAGYYGDVVQNVWNKEGRI